MKKRSLTKVMAMLMACAMVMGNTGMVVHATDDGCDHGDGRESVDQGGGGGSLDAGSSDSGSSSSGGGESYSAPSGGGGNSGGGSSDSGSDYSGGGDSYVAPSGDSGNGGGSTATAPSGLATKGNTATIPGCETFRHIWYPKDGRASIYHCGIEQYTAQLMDADGNAVAYKYASPYKDEATGKWYLNIITEDGVDTTGYTIGTYKGSVDYLPKLGMSGVMLNEVVVVNAEETATK